MDVLQSASGPIPRTGSTEPNATPSAVRRLRVRPALVRLGALALIAAGLSLTGWQTARILAGRDWSSDIALASIGLSFAGALALLAWTWIVVENARRLLCLARTHEPPSPGQAVGAWSLPLIVAASAGLSVTFLQQRLTDGGEAETSPVPLAIVLVGLLVVMFAMYRPLFILSAITRRLGGPSATLARWVWIPIAIAVVGSGSLIALKYGGAYGEDVEAIAPAWALGVVALAPIGIMLVLAWRGGATVEEAVASAYDRHNKVNRAGVGRGRLGLWARALRADARPPIARDKRRRIRLVPGAEVLRLSIVTAIAALALLSIVGAIVMYLFWREATDGVLLPGQRDRALDALRSLQTVERYLAVGVLGLASIWSFVTVLNARLATGRRRNPFLAAVAWPVAGVGIWLIADRYADDESIRGIVTSFALQAIVLFIPFFLLERAAVTVGARRQPIRAACGLGVVLLVHVQGLAGLSTLGDVADTSRFGRLAGYLALAALLELVSTLAVTEASRMIADAANHEVDRHNFLAEQRDQVDRVAHAPQAGPSVAPVGDPLVDSVTPLG